MNLVWATDDNYVPLTGVSITSALENNQDVDVIKIWILDDGISEEGRNQLTECVNIYGRDIEFLSIKQQGEEIKISGVLGWGKNSSSFTTYGRLFIGRLLSSHSVKRALYCDSDLIINGSLKPLLEMDMMKKPLGMAMDYCRAEVRNQVGMDYSEPYYQAGVLLIDIERWNAEKCFDLIMDFIKNTRPEYIFVDQDLLNFALHDKIISLPANYNVNQMSVMFSYKLLCLTYGLTPQNYYTEKDFNNDMNNIVVYHCSGPNVGKPWDLNNRNPFDRIWNKYFEISIWKNSFKKETRYFLFAENVFWILYKFFPRIIISFIMKIMSKNSMLRLVEIFDEKYGKVSIH